VLERILENWLTSLNERGYEIPFTQLLSAEGFRVLHGPVHHPFEHGKDILALSQRGDLCAFQLKGGDIDLAELESIQGQLLALCATAVTYPGVEPPRRPGRVALVTNGKLTPPARSRIEAFNHGNRPLGFPVLECIEGEHLVGRFKDAHQQYLPSTPRDLNMFLNLYLADGNGPFPIDEFFIFVNALIGPAIESGSRRQIQRALASMVLFTAYTTSPWERSKNYVGIAEAWLSGALTILRVASEIKLPEEEWLSSYELALEGGRTALADLLAEAAAREDLLIPDLAEGLVYPVRCLITCGYLAAFSISESLLVGGNDHRDQVQKVIAREISYLGSPGESGAPFLFNIAAALESWGDSREGLKIVVKWANTLIRANQMGSPLALADPYHRFNDILLASLDEEDIEERFDGHAYTLHIAIDWLARRNLRQVIEAAWPQLSKLALCEFQCSTPAKILSSTRDEDGRLLTWLPATPESWARLYERASSVDESDLPMELWRHAEMIPYLGLLLPFRFTSPIAKALDFFTTRNCNISFVGEPEEDSKEADAESGQEPLTEPGPTGQQDPAQG
jgi:hypothetical protein